MRAVIPDSRATQDIIVPAGNGFLLGLIFNQRVRAARAWAAPQQLLDRLPQCPSFDALPGLSPDDVVAAIAASPALHPMAGTVGRWAWLAMARVCEQYSGDASNIWEPDTDSDSVRQRLVEFDGIGPHKAAVGLFILTTVHGVRTRDSVRTAEAFGLCPALAEQQDRLVAAVR